MERWDLEGFRTDWYQKSLRVVRSLETTQERKRIARKWVDAQKITDWWWATTLPKALAPTARVAVLYGHGRWQIENEGFNELSNHWHADHYFHHHPVAITALWLILFAAHALFHSFWTGNLKSPSCTSPGNWPLTSSATTSAWLLPEPERPHPLHHPSLNAHPR